MYCGGQHLPGAAGVQYYAGTEAGSITGQAAVFGDRRPAAVTEQHYAPVGLAE